MEYKLKEALSEELVVLESDKFKVQMWGLSRLTKRHRGDSCAICEENVGDKAYRPATNLGNRMERICVNCINRLKKEQLKL